MLTRCWKAVALAGVLSACGAAHTTPKEGENAANDDDGGAQGATEGGADPITGEKPAALKPCEGFEVDLDKALSQASCEVPNAPADEKARDVKGVLDVKVVPSSTKVAGGSSVELTIYFANKGKEPLPLNFMVDPEPRITFEVYTKKSNKRVDAPAGKEPDLPAAVANAQAPEKKTARATLVPQGTATLKVSWTAVKYKWAPAERAKGAAPGRGYPKVAAGPLPKGVYVVKVNMPLIGIFEGVNHEVSTQQVEIEIQ